MKKSEIINDTNKELMNLIISRFQLSVTSAKD
jgi:hypothetical protein